MNESGAAEGGMAAQVGENLVSLRKKVRLSQERLADALQAAELLDWTQTTVRDVEGGRRHLRLEEALALCAFFGVSLQQLLSGAHSQVSLGDRQAISTAALRSLLGHGDPATVLPRTQSVLAFSGQLPEAPLTPKLRKELEEFERIGGDVAQLHELRNRLARGELHEKEYAGLKLGMLRKIRARSASR